MLLALLVLAIVAAALAAPLAFRAAESWSARRARARKARRVERRELRDPGRERRAEQRARELLRSCVNDEEWGMYRDLGFIRVGGRLSRKGRAGEPKLDRDDVAGETAAGETPAGETASSILDTPSGNFAADSNDNTAPVAEQPPYAYLIYPHKPIVAYVPKSGRLLSEYCVEFPDLTGAISQTRLPDSDDVLAKWMALTGDEERLIRNANMHLPGRQVDPGRVRRDLWRLSEWERQRRGYGPVRAPRT
ncbi:MAG: hypothetical protein QOF55_2247 [Thermoleophilaceae bacterium]|nr:hypothetical protein [Thermoleophilaceae bacterium]